MPYITNFNFKQFVNPELQPVEGSKILQIIMVDEFPAKYSFAIQFTLIFDNPYIEHAGYLEFYRPDGTVLSKSSSFRIKASEKPVIGDEDYEVLTGVAYELVFKDIVFDRPGLYIMKLYCDGNEVGKFGITVVDKNE